jgi:hypothetical protein
MATPTVPIELDAVKTDAVTVLTFAAQSWDTTTIRAVADSMDKISATQVEINNEAATIAGLPHPAPPAPAAGSGS